MVRLFTTFKPKIFFAGRVNEEGVHVTVVVFKVSNVPLQGMEAVASEVKDCVPKMSVYPIVISIDPALVVLDAIFSGASKETYVEVL
jgi:hypothetical protein